MIRLVACCAILTLVSGCAAPPLNDESADDALKSAIARGYKLTENDSKAIADGEISFEEYEHAAKRYRACMAKNETPLSNFLYYADIRRYDWTLKETYLEDPKAQACERSLQLIDMLWQTQVATELEPVREARRVRVIECMRGKGLDADPDLSYPDVMMRAMVESPECVDAEFE